MKEEFFEKVQVPTRLKVKFYKRKQHHRKRSQPKLDDITKLTIDASRMMIGVGASLAVAKGVTEALKK